MPAHVNMQRGCSSGKRRQTDSLSPFRISHSRKATDAIRSGNHQSGALPLLNNHASQDVWERSRLLNPQKKSGDDDRVMPVVHVHNEIVRSHRREFIIAGFVPPVVHLQMLATSSLLCACQPTVTGGARHAQHYAPFECTIDHLDSVIPMGQKVRLAKAQGAVAEVGGGKRTEGRGWRRNKPTG